MIDLTKDYSSLKRRMLLVHRIYPSMDKKLIKIERRIFLYNGAYEDTRNNIWSENVVSEDRLKFDMSTDMFGSSVEYKPVSNPTLAPNESQKIMSKKDASTDPLGQYGEFSGTLSMNYSTKDFQASIMVDILNKNNKIDYRVHWRSDNSISSKESFIVTIVCNDQNGVLKSSGDSLYLISLVYDITNYTSGNQDRYIILNNKIVDQNNLKYLEKENAYDLFAYNSAAYEAELDGFNLANVGNLGMIRQIRKVEYISDSFGHVPDEEEVTDI